MATQPNHHEDPSSPEASAARSVSVVGRAATVAQATRMAANAVSAARADFWSAVARCAA
jgi:hypothetical protein